MFADEIAVERDNALEERHAVADVMAGDDELPVGGWHGNDHHVADTQIARKRDGIEPRRRARRRVVSKPRIALAEAR